MAQLVERPTLDLDSGHDPRVVGIEPCARLCNEHGVCLRFPLSLSLPLSPTLAHSVSKLKAKKGKRKETVVKTKAKGMGDPGRGLEEASSEEVLSEHLQ